MSGNSPTVSSPSSIFFTVLNAALKIYQTKHWHLDHPLATQLESCDSAVAILSILRDLVQQFDQSPSLNGRLKNWLRGIVHVLSLFSVTHGEQVRMVSLKAIVSESAV